MVSKPHPTSSISFQHSGTKSHLVDKMLTIVPEPITVSFLKGWEIYHKVEFLPSQFWLPQFQNEFRYFSKLVWESLMTRSLLEAIFDILTKSALPLRILWLSKITLSIEPIMKPSLVKLAEHILWNYIAREKGGNISIL